MKYVFGDRLKDETFKLELVKSIKQLISSGEILATGETMSVTEKGLLNFYLIR
jgi:hypothetical protein